MKGRITFLVAALATLAVTTALPGLTAGHGSHGGHHGQADLAEVRAATAQFHRVEVAQEAGWVFVDGLDDCFENPGVGGMGHHLINLDLLDTTLDPRQPEALVYAPDRQGRLKLVAVEWIVPADAWAATGASEPPMVLGRHLHLNEALGVWVMHAWIFHNNPDGVFEDWNPRVSCHH